MLIRRRHVRRTRLLALVVFVEKRPAFARLGGQTLFDLPRLRADRVLERLALPAQQRGVIVNQLL